MTTYTAVTQENEKDLAILAPNHYLLQVAKSLSSPKGEPSFNVVYQSALLGPNMSVFWKETYATNWCSEIAAPGANVVYSGVWIPCALGASFVLNDKGYFKAEPNNPSADPNSLNVASNNYSVPVNIIVGVQDPKDPTQFTPV